MATNYFLRTTRKSGMATLFARIRSRKLNVDIKASTCIEVDIERWNYAHKSTASLKRFQASEEGKILFTKLDKISDSIDAILCRGEMISQEKVKEIIDQIVFSEVYEEELQKEMERLMALEREKEEEARRKRMTLNKYIDLYLEQAKSGARKTLKGTNFAEGTIKAIRQVQVQFKGYQEFIKQEIDFDDITLDFRNKFLTYLYNERNYNTNSASKCINTLYTIMNNAESEGHHNNRKYLAKQFRGKRVDVDTIYLTKEELTAMKEADLSELSPGHELARDIFMVGVYTAQRVSDYNHITKDNIKTTESGDKVIELRQQKTGTWVSIPVKPELMEILKKYNFELPYLCEQKINEYIKKVGEVAQINTPVTIENTKSGKVTFTTSPKYKLIHTHTARRTGATLMYLAGMNVFNICSVTGHTSIAMLKKYIKADNLEKAKTISSDAGFSKW